MTQVREREGQPIPRPLTQAEFYLAMKEVPDPNKLGLPSVLRHFFVGQEAAYAALRSAIADASPRSVIAIPGPFGAGKNTLLNVVVSDMIADGQLERDAIRRAHVDFDLREGQTWEETFRRTLPEEERNRTVRVLSIDEISYQWEGTNKKKGEFTEKLHIASKFLGSEAEIVILLGDDALRDPEVVGALGSPYEPVYVELDRLTPEIVLKALRIRLGDALERPVEAIDIDNLIDPELMRVLVPDTDYPLVQVRGVLSELEYLGSNLRPLNIPARITPELARNVYGNNWYEDFWRSKNPWDQAFRIWFRNYLRGLLQEGQQIKALSLEEIIKNSGMNIDPNNYKRLYQFLKYNVLHIVDYSKGLYLPTPKFLLESSVMQLPLDPDSELGKKEVKRIQDVFYDNISFRRAGATNQRSVEVIVSVISAAYGWDQSFVVSLFREVLEGFEDRKAREEREQKEEMGRIMKELSDRE